MTPIESGHSFFYKISKYILSGEKKGVGMTGHVLFIDFSIRQSFRGAIARVQVNIYIYIYIYFFIPTHTPTANTYSIVKDCTYYKVDLKKALEYVENGGKFQHGVSYVYRKTPTLCTVRYMYIYWAYIIGYRTYKHSSNT